MIRNITVGIDIGTSTTRVVVSEHRKEARMPIILGTGVAESRGVRHGYIVNATEAVKSVRRAAKEAEKNSGISIRQAVLSIGEILRQDQRSFPKLIAKSLF
jgi:cell division protein FtsA